MRYCPYCMKDRPDTEFLNYHWCRDCVNFYQRYKRKHGHSPPLPDRKRVRNPSTEKKWCPKCRQWKFVSTDFYMHKSGPMAGKAVTPCRACRIKYNKEKRSS